MSLLAMSPDFLSWVDGLRTAGVCIPQPVLDLARLDGVPRDVPAEAATPMWSGSHPAQAHPVASSCSLGVGMGSGLSQGSASATKWFDDSVNVGASTSGCERPATRVFFSTSICDWGGWCRC